MGLPIDTAIIVSLFTGCVLYGIFLVLFFASLHVLIWRRTTTRPNYVLIAASITLFCFLTAHEGIALARGLDAFVTYRNTIGPDRYLAQFWRGEFIAWTAILSVSGLFADCILMYRCWIVWGGSWRSLIAPFVLFVAQVVVLPFAAVTRPNVMSIADACSERVSKFTLLFIALEVVQNVTTTGLIAWRIWSINRAVRRSRQGDLTPAFSLVVESGALYSGSVFVLLMTSVAGSCAIYIMFEIVSNMLGITFSLLIVRVALSRPRAPTSLAVAPSIPTSTATMSADPSATVKVVSSVESEGPVSSKGSV